MSVNLNETIEVICGDSGDKRHWFDLITYTCSLHLIISVFDELFCFCPIYSCHFFFPSVFSKNISYCGKGPICLVMMKRWWTDKSRNLGFPTN